MSKIIVNFVRARALTHYPCSLGGHTDKEQVLLQVTEGPEEGFSVAPNFLRKYTDLDAELEKAATDLDHQAGRAREAARRLRDLKGGRLVLPTYAAYRAECRRVEREEVEAPLLDAESNLARLVAAGASGDKISYAKINVAACRKQLEHFYSEGGDVPNYWEPLEFGNNDVPETGDGTGVPVRVEIARLGLDGAGQVVLQYAVCDPISITLPPERISHGTLFTACRAIGIDGVEEPEELLFQPFTALMDDDANITRFFIDDDEPVIPVFEPGKRRPWGTVIGRLADREERRAAA
jgi:hypothetical protein